MIEWCAISAVVGALFLCVGYVGSMFVANTVPTSGKYDKKRVEIYSEIYPVEIIKE